MAAAALIAVLREARGLVARPGNDFSWSSWDDARAAVEELEGLVRALEAGERPARIDLDVLFAPTGPLQEVSLSSGWGEEFLALAERFDAALAKF